MGSEQKRWHAKFHEEFGKESDRAIPIVVGALLEQALEALLRNHLVPCSGRDPLFDGSNAPLGSFSSKIDLAERLGLLSPRWARDLHLVRKIRNDFAHNLDGCTFNDPSVQNRVLELTRSQQVVEAASDLRSGYPDGPKGDFGITVSWMLWWLRGLVEAVSRVPPAKDWVPSANREGGQQSLGAAVAQNVPAADERT